MKKICKIDGCNLSHNSNGYCQKHDWRWRKYGDPLYLKIKRIDHSLKCKIKDCANYVRTDGLCIKHYGRQQRHGNSLIVKTIFHGMSKTPEYRTWKLMRNRCYRESDKSYSRYGGRGITVCDRWKNSFVNFYEDMGKRSFPKAQIDRIDNDGNYEPDNCRWVTMKENLNNRRYSKL